MRPTLLAPAGWCCVIVLACLFPLLDDGQLRPPHPTSEYLRTLDALQQYRVWAAADDGELLPKTDRPVEPDDQYEGVPRLIRLLARIGDLPSEADIPDSNLYQGALVNALKHFQSRHGLEPDGRIDQTTLAQLNTPLAFRVHQLELAVERLRHGLYDSSRPAIVINLPEFRLRAFGPGDDLELEMKVIVGQAADHKTPILSSQLEAVVLRPYWYVPLSIQQDELVPEVDKDPSFLRDNHLEAISAQGGVVSPDSDDLADLLSSGRLRLRQSPGPKNVLGLAKFVFPNQYGIYMHGTSAQWLFSHPRRDLSHGCIRVERAKDLAEWTLRNESGWTRDHIVRAMQGPQSVTVKLHHPIQLVTTYVTAVVLKNGEIHFCEDIYDEDAAFDKELAKSAGRLSSHARLRP